jgi:DNA-binding LacI/PurR family transcriptional regulator
MTTVEQNKEQMGRIAVRLLLEQIQSAGDLIREGIVLPTELIQRASVRTIERSNT